MVPETHDRKPFRPETIGWRTFLFAGFAALLGTPLLRALLQNLFSEISLNITSLIFQAGFSAAILLFVFSLAKKRMEEGTVQADRLMKTLTPAQISLTVSLALFLLAWLFYVLDWRSVLRFCVFAGYICLQAAVVFFIIRAVKNRGRRKKARQAKKFGRVICVKCGKWLKNDGTVPHMGNKYYCKECYRTLQNKLSERKTGQTREEREARQKLVNTLSEILKLRTLQEKVKEAERRAKEAEQLAREEERRERESKAACSVCGIVHRKNELVLVDDRYYCGSCLKGRFPADAPAVAGEDPASRTDAFDRETFLKTYKARLKSRLPENIEDPDVQTRLLANLGQLFPALQTIRASELLLNWDSDTEITIERIAHRISSALTSGTAPNLDAAADDQLIDAFLLLDYYAFLLKQDASGGIRSAEDIVGSMLVKRLSKTD